MKKQVFSVLLCAALMTTLCACGNTPKSVPEVSVPQDGDGRVNPIAEVKPEWEYTEDRDGSIQITGYNGKAASVKVPPEIDGKPVTSLFSMTFVGADKVTSIVEIPASVTYLRGSTFGNTVTEVIVANDNPEYYSKDGIVYSKNETLVCCPWGKRGEITVPDGIKRIGSYAFGGDFITKIVLPESVDTIENGAFARSERLTSVNIPRAVTEIEAYTFSNCESLETLEIPDSVTKIGAHAFANTPFLEKLQKENPLVVMRGILVDGTTAAGKVTIPENVTVIAGDAFSPDVGENALLTKVVIPDNVTEIGSYAFKNCTALEEVRLPDGLKAVSLDMFSNCKSLKTVDIPNGVKNIWHYAFKDCESLTSVNVPDSVVMAIDNCFDGCEKINVTFRGKTYTAENITDFYTAVSDGAPGE